MPILNPKVGRNAKLVAAIAVIIAICACALLILGNQKTAQMGTRSNPYNSSSYYGAGYYSVKGSIVYVSNQMQLNGKLGTVTESNATTTAIPTTTIPTTSVQINYTTTLEYNSSADQDKDNYIYCIGGFEDAPLDNVYYSHISTSGNITGWSATEDYPVNIYGQSCISFDGYIYCSSGSTIDYTFYSEATASGISKWKESSTYPLSLYTSSCAQLNGTAYCIGGDSYCRGCYDWTNADLVYDSPINQTGLGEWHGSNSYPLYVYGQSCVAAEGRIYSIGGYNASLVDEDFFDYNQTYFAQISGSRVGNWTLTSPYPIKVADESCATNGSYIYCVGGTTPGNSRYGDYVEDDVVYAPITPNGIGKWSFTTPYPLSTSGSSCVISNGYLYCIAGTGVTSNGIVYNNMTYYAPIVKSGVGNWTEAKPYPLGDNSLSCIVANFTSANA